MTPKRLIIAGVAVFLWNTLALYTESKTGEVSMFRFLVFVWPLLIVGGIAWSVVRRIREGGQGDRRAEPDKPPVRRVPDERLGETLTDEEAAAIEDRKWARSKR